MQIEKPVMPSRLSVSWILHYSFQEQIIETKNQINVKKLLYCSNQEVYLNQASKQIGWCEDKSKRGMSGL